MTKHLLFLCGRNRLRSPTAEHLFAKWPEVETASAGLNPDADNPVCSEMIEWADVVLVMEHSQRRKLNEQFGKRLAQKRVVVLDIADDYKYMQPELVRLLEAKVPAILGLSRPSAGHVDDKDSEG